MDNLYNRKTGNQGESLACEYLQSNGLEVLAKNFKCNSGEIDLIMKENETIVFVEVRSRFPSDYVNPIESVSDSKLKKIYRTAVYYLMGMDWFGIVDSRIDIVGIDLQSGKLEWVKNVFEV